jgi:transposase-like protein
MITCPTCQRAPTKRDGRDHRGRQRYACRPCYRDFTAGSSSVFAGYRWPAEVILAAVRWYLSYPLSARQVTELLAERGIDVSPRTVLTWVQSFAPQLALAGRPYRRRIGGGGTSTRSSCSAEPRNATSTAPSINTGR